MTKIVYLHEKIKDFSKDEINQLDAMLVGALSFWTEEKLWKKLVDQYVEEIYESKRSKTV